MTNKETIVEDFKNKLMVKNDAIEDVLAKLEKACLLLDEWLTDYNFREKPDPRLIFDKSIADTDKRREQAQKWFWEYYKITGFIDIASDYIYGSRKVLEQAIKVQEDNETKEAV